jgi:hypothetical protein
MRIDELQDGARTTLSASAWNMSLLAVAFVCVCAHFVPRPHRPPVVRHPGGTGIRHPGGIHHGASSQWPYPQNQAPLLGIRWKKPAADGSVGVDAINRAYENDKKMWGESHEAPGLSGFAGLYDGRSSLDGLFRLKQDQDEPVLTRRERFMENLRDLFGL